MAGPKRVMLNFTVTKAADIDLALAEVARWSGVQRAARLDRAPISEISARMVVVFADPGSARAVLARIRTLPGVEPGSASSADPLG